MDTRAHVAVDFASMGVAVTVYRRTDQHTMVYRPDGAESGFGNWEVAPHAVTVEPSYRITDEVAKALLEALLDHYRGGHDARQLRADYQAERARVDKLLDALISGGAR